MSPATKRVRFSRRQYVSLGRKIARPQLSDQANKKLFGSLWAPAGWGQNVALTCTMMGPVDRDSGMVVPLPSLDKALKELGQQWDHRFLNEQEVFRDMILTNENLVQFGFRFLQERLKEEGQDVQIESFHLQEDPHHWAENRGEKEVLIGQSYTVSCLHRHHNPQMSQAENQHLYGKCAEIHGHSYGLEVVLQGPVEHQTGLVYSRDQLDRMVNREILEPYHGKFLNESLGNTSGELILQKFMEKLMVALPQDLFLELRLQETKKNSFCLKNPLFSRPSGGLRQEAHT